MTRTRVVKEYLFTCIRLTAVTTTTTKSKVPIVYWNTRHDSRVWVFRVVQVYNIKGMMILYYKMHTIDKVPPTFFSGP